MNNEHESATLDDVVAVLENNQETLNELLTWTKIENAHKVKHVLETTLDTSDKKIVYHLSDGSGIKEIENNCRVSDSQISRYQKKWYKLGIMKKVGSRGRGDKHIKAFNLEDFDIDVPKIENKTEPSATEQQISESEDSK